MNKTIGVVVGIIVVGAVIGVAMMYGGGSGEPVVTATPAESLVPTTAAGGTGPFVQQAPSDEPAMSDSLTPTPTPKQLAMISITDTGFDTATLTVAVGTKVTFTNNGQALHWPASDPHPTHGGLPGFDAEHGLATGESYSFTFTKVGTFGFHDHLNTTLKGTVVVQ